MPKSVAYSGVVTLFKLHCRLGHLSLPLLKKLRASAPFELVHSDVWDPCPVLSPIMFKYFITFVDDFSRVTWLYLMKSCYELFSHFSSFFAEIQTQFHVSVSFSIET